MVQSFNGDYKTIYATKVGVGLGLGGINENMLAKDAMARGVETLANYKNICDELGATEIYAFGTSAIRNAMNNQIFIHNVKKEIAIDISVISGEEEARLIYKGVKQGYDFSSPAVIMDIGGGSTEFIFANNSGIILAESFEIGAARIFQMFDFTDPISAVNIREIEQYLDKGVGDFFDQIKCNILIGASGSFETFYELIEDQDYPKDTFVEIDLIHLEHMLTKIIASSKQEREANNRIIAIRKKMAPIAAVKIRWIIRKLGIQKIIISPFAMKEGILQHVIQKGKGL